MRAGHTSQRGQRFPLGARHGARYTFCFCGRDARCRYASRPVAMCSEHVCLLGFCVSAPLRWCTVGPLGHTSTTPPQKTIYIYISKYKYIYIYIYHMHRPPPGRARSGAARTAGPGTGVMLGHVPLPRRGGRQGGRAAMRTGDRGSKGHGGLVRRPVRGCACWVPGFGLRAFRCSRGPGTLIIAPRDARRKPGRVDGP